MPYLIDKLASESKDNKTLSINAKRVGLFVLENLVWFLTLAIFIAFGLLIEGFFTPNVAYFILYISSPIGILVLAQSLCLLSGNFDLSIAQNAGLSALIVGLIIGREMPGVIPTSIAIALVPLLGGVLGAVNGFFIGILKINSFLVTLSTYLIYEFLAYYLLTQPIPGYHLPAGFLALGGWKLGPIYITFYAFLLIAIILSLFLKNTAFGIKIYAVGSDYEIAKTAGINADQVLFWVYVMAGVLAGIAGLAYAGFGGSISNSMAGGEVFWSFAGAIIGGVSMKGGRGKILGAMGGALLLGVIGSGVVLLDITATLRDVIKGLVVLAAVLIGKYRTSAIDRLLMPSKI
jgi:ribose/xylose/arabinose/galactoside ABC-type transport system permease subunit